MYSKEETWFEINYYKKNFNIVLIKILNTITLSTHSVMYHTQCFYLTLTV